MEVIPILFYDFEVFAYDWLVVVRDMDARKEHVIINDRDKLANLYNENINNIWTGFNSRNYDQYILKGILCGFNPKDVSDWIIVRNKPGWKFSSLLKMFPLNNYDVMTNIDRGLKLFEGFMGNDIRETSVPFDIDRKLTQAEIEQTVFYCKHDVEQTIEVFLKRKEDFDAHMGLVKLVGDGEDFDLSLISKTKPQLSAIILEATKQEHNDEFDIDFPDTLRIAKYTNVIDWYRNREHLHYTDASGNKMQLQTVIAGCPHTFGWGGVHGALKKYSGEGYYLMADVASLYPSLMIRYNLYSRNMKDPKKFKEIYQKRLALKAAGDPLHRSLKLVLNSTYGVMKDASNALYDPRQSNRVCVYGQLLILDLIEKLEPHCQLIQSNTDGILIKMRNPNDYDKIDDICAEWEARTGLNLEFDEYRKVYQKDVNNYVLVPHGELYTEQGKPRWKSKGAYVKKLSALDYDLPIINQALIDYTLKGVPVEKTIYDCNDLKEFQLVTKITGKYDYIRYGSRKLNEKCIRIFASKIEDDPGVFKIHSVTKRLTKIQNSPEHCFIWNDNVNGVQCPAKLDKQWYVNLAKKRLSDFGVESE